MFAEPPLPPAPATYLVRDYEVRKLVVNEWDEPGPVWTRDTGVYCADVPVDGLRYHAFVYTGNDGKCLGVALNGWAACMPLWPPPPDPARWSRLLRAFFGPGVLADYRAAAVVQQGPWGRDEKGYQRWLRGKRFTYEVTSLPKGYQAIHVAPHAEAERSRRWQNANPP